MKKIISILLILALALSLAACGLSFGGKGGSSAAKAKEQKPAIIRGMLKDDDSAVVPTDKGSVIKINDEVSSAVLSPDRNTLVVFLKDGTLYYTDAEQNEKHQVTDNADWLSVVRNEGAFYITEDSDVYCVVFETGETIKLGNDIDGIVAPDSLAAFLYDEDGGLYLLRNGELEKIGKQSGDVRACSVSNDGAHVTWSVVDDGKTTLYCYENDERAAIGSMDGSYSSVFSASTEDEGLVILACTSAKELFIKKPGEEGVKVRLGNTLDSRSIYCPKGLVTEVDAADVTSLYVLVDADKENNLDCISLDGERERMLSGVTRMAISNGYIVYSDDENTMFCAALDGAELKDEFRIASDVDVFRVKGDYIYYIRNYDDGAGTLYCRKLGDADAEAVKVASDVGCYVGSWSNDYLCVNLSGDTVFFFRSMEEIKDSYYDMGVLYKWTFGDEEPTKIATDVVQGTVTSFLLSGEIIPDRLGFMKFDSNGENRDIIGDLYYYDGSDISKIASEVIY